MRTPLRLFLCLFLTGIHLSLYSQAEESLPADRVSIKGTYTLKKIFDLIYRQTKQQVTYANTLLDDRERVTVDVSGTIDEALTVVLAGKAITWVYSEGYVALRRKSAGISIESSSPAESTPLVTIRGIIRDEKGTPLPGVTVMIKNSRKGTQSDHDGTFVLSEVNRNAILIISSIGFEREEVSIKKGHQITITLKQSENILGEVVVAYGTTTQRANTGAVTVVKGEQIQSLPNRSFDKSLQGLVPGLLITNGTGQPGGGVSNMVLRGISTGSEAWGNSTVRNPLIVIDGIPVTQNTQLEVTGFYTTPATNPLAQLNPSDIESISVLKDAAAISLYGTKAANGVILVTTKRGQPGKTTFGLRSQTDLSFRPANSVKMLDQSSYLELLYETYKNTSPIWTDETIKADLYKKFPYRVNGSDTSFYPMADWYDAVYEKRAMTFSNELYMSGGNEKTSYYMNLGYTKQHGIVTGSGFDRKSVRFNFDNKPARWIKIGFNTALSYTEQDLSNINAGNNEFALAEFMSPLNPIRLADGNLVTNYIWGIPQSSSFQVANPVAVQLYNTNTSNAFRGLSQLFGEVYFLKDFSFSSALGIDFMLAENKRKQDPRLRNEDFSGNGSIAQSDVRRANIINTNILRYRKTIRGHHTVNALLGQEAQILTEKNTRGASRGTDKALPYYDDLLSPGYTLTTINFTRSRQTLLSQFGQLNYDYRNKYFLSASTRRDGSSVFGDKQKWGTYWSIGGGWTVTSEAFASGKNWLPYLKIRGSLGSAGSSGPIGELMKFNQLNTNTLQNMPAFDATETAGNPYIQWEETFSWDAGIEARFFNDRLQLTADVYSKKTSDLVYTTKVPTYTGYRATTSNIGDIRNNGIELAVIAHIIRTPAFSWRMNANWSTNKNILLRSHVPLLASASGTIANEEGRNFASFYMRKWAGVNPADGKPQWIDSTGKPTSDYNAAKKEFVGKPQPDGFGAVTNTFTYKGFELAFQLYYQYGFQLYDERLSYRLSDGTYPFINQSVLAMDRWQKPGDIALNPKRTLNNTSRGNNISTRYLLQGDYIRLQFIKLHYSVPKRILQHLKLNALQLFIQGNNLGILTKYTGWDPDNANVGGGVGSPYPISRSYSAGLNIQL